jgi:hypothetical protein
MSVEGYTAAIAVIRNLGGVITAIKIQGGVLLG